MLDRVRTLFVVASMLAATAVAVPAAIAEPAAASAGSGAKVSRFPRNFLWGVATSGFQSEGSFPDSNWTRYAAKKDEPYKDSVDFRHRYPEDIKRARDLGVKAFRTSVEWARIEPRRGKHDLKELAYYDDVVRRIRAAGMRPMLTLDHWVYPGWVADRGGWANPRTAADWLRNARFVVERYKRLGVMWITFNEASAYMTNELVQGGLKPGDILTMRTGLTKAHRAAYDMIHKVDPGAMVSSNIAYGSPVNAIFDAVLFNQITDKLDFIGIDYYWGLSLDNLTLVNWFSGRYWDVDPAPDGLYYVLKNYHRRLPKLPVYIVENGMTTGDGVPRKDGYTRSDHLRDHLYWVQRAMADGVKVIGYNYWSLTDNYEWGSYHPRFGLYTVDVLTDPKLVRRPTDAVAAYRSIIRANGVPPGYVPVRRPSWCSIEDPIATCLTRTPTPPAP